MFMYVCVQLFVNFRDSTIHVCLTCRYKFDVKYYATENNEHAYYTSL